MTSHRRWLKLVCLLGIDKPGNLGWHFADCKFVWFVQYWADWNLYLFVWFDSLRPINSLSLIKRPVFLGWTSTKLGLMFLLKDTTQWHRWGSNPRPLSLESSTQPLRSLLEFICGQSFSRIGDKIASRLCHDHYFWVPPDPTKSKDQFWDHNLVCKFHNILSYDLLNCLLYFFKATNGWIISLKKKQEHLLPLLTSKQTHLKVGDFKCDLTGVIFRLQIKEILPLDWI